MRRLIEVAVLMSILGLASSALGGPGIGDPAPDFIEPDTGGTDHSLSEFAGNAILLNFWTSW